MRLTDPAVERALREVSPLNTFGVPAFRVVWSPDVLQWAAGWWHDYDSQTGLLLRRVFEARRAPKYQCAPRWVLERWMPPEFFGPKELWDQVTTEWSKTHGVVAELGPYPSEGDWVFVWKCEDAQGEFMEITPTLARYAVELAMRPVPTVAELRAEIESRQKVISDSFTSQLDGMLGDPFPFLGRAHNLDPRPRIDKVREQVTSEKEL